MIPLQRHIDCVNSECAICLEDHTALGEYLYATIPASKDVYDILAEYVAYLTKKEIYYQTIYGWATEICFDKATLDGFMERFREMKEIHLCHRFYSSHCANWSCYPEKCGEPTFHPIDELDIVISCTGFRLCVPDANGMSKSVDTGIDIDKKDGE